MKMSLEVYLNYHQRRPTRFTIMYPGSGRYTYNNAGGNNGYQRPMAPPPNQQYGQQYGQQYEQQYGQQYGQQNDQQFSQQYAPPPGPPPMAYNRPVYPPPQFQQEQAKAQLSNGYNNPNVNASNMYGPPQNMSLPPPQTQTIQGTDQPYQYSQCTGRRKALIIGINYIGSKNQLRGCINDAHNIFNFLTNGYGYSSDDIVILTDDQNDLVRVPTRANMIRAMQWLVKDAQPNDSLFLHYSGHGGQTEDLDGDEEDGMDDVIYPVDFETQGPIIDDEMHYIMVKPLQQGVRLTALFDSCHSGTVLDLPYTYSTKGIIKEPNIWKDVGQDGLQAAISYATGNRAALIGSLGSIFKTVKGGMGNNVDRERVRQIKFSAADVVMLSGSKDNQTSADAVEDGQNTGAMSHAFIKVMTLQPQQSYLSLLQNMRKELAGKYSQKPQLSSSHPIDVNLQFIM